MGEGSGVLLLPELGLGLDFPFGNSQQSSFLSQTSPSNKTPAGNEDGVLTAKQEFHRIPWISVLVCLDCSRAEVPRCRSRRDELRAGVYSRFPSLHNLILPLNFLGRASWDFWDPCLVQVLAVCWTRGSWKLGSWEKPHGVGHSGSSWMRGFEEEHGWIRVVRAGIPRSFSQREKIPQRGFLAVLVGRLFPPFSKHKSIKQENEAWDCLRIYGREGWDWEAPKSKELPEVPSWNWAFLGSCPCSHWDFFCGKREKSRSMPSNSHIPPLPVLPGVGMLLLCYSSVQFPEAPCG